MVTSLWDERCYRFQDLCIVPAERRVTLDEAKTLIWIEENEQEEH